VSWLRKEPEGVKSSRRRELPEGLWTKCVGCGEILYLKNLEESLHVCPKCGHHFRISAVKYAEYLLDPGTAELFGDEVVSTDPLAFRGSKRYVDRLKAARAKTGLREAVLTFRATAGGYPVVAALMDFSFIGGSMGSAVGERIARAIRVAIDERRPLLILSASGGARMEEGILSLMQMAKISVLLARLAEERVPFVSLLTHPTTGGVAASFSSLGDVIVAEPGAQIGFAGPRVIKETVGQDLPAGFQTSEFLLQHGMVDAIVHRKDLRATLVRLLRFFHANLAADGGRPLAPSV
jgi:acetyl-CoA carboxylase carboxyl transferase subunit beta